jgi:hypothetical protein
MISKTFPDFSWSFHKSKNNFELFFFYFLRRLSSIDIVVALIICTSIFLRFCCTRMSVFRLTTEFRLLDSWYEKMECNANAQLKEIDKRMEAPLPLKSVWRKRHFDPSLHGIQVIGVAVKSIALVVVWDIELERQQPNDWRRHDEPITVK